MRYSNILMAMLLGLLLIACENRKTENTPNRDANDRPASELRNDTREDLDRAKDNLKVEKEEYENHVQAYLDKLDNRIDRLKDRAKNERSSAKVATNREISRLEKDREVVKNRLDDMKSATAESWKDIRRDLDKLMVDHRESSVKND